MNGKKQILQRFLIFLFTVSVSVTVLPCGMINILGLFGEVKSSAVTEDRDAEKTEERRLSEIKHSVRGPFYYNIWFEVWIGIVCAVLIGYMIHLPGEDTIVTLKVRMDH